MENENDSAIEGQEILTEIDKNDSSMKRIDVFFSELSPGATLLIQRTQPSWCSGVLEEIIVGDEPPGIDYFIDTWGGECLNVKARNRGGQLKGSYKLDLKTYPPLLHGKRIYPPDKADKFRDQPVAAPQERSPIVVSQASPPPAPAFSFDRFIAGATALAPIILRYLENNEARRREDMLMMMKLAGGGGGGAATDITKVGQAMLQMQQLLQNAGGGGGGAESSDFIPQALEVAKMFLSSQGQEKPKAKLTRPFVSVPPSPGRPSIPTPAALPSPSGTVTPLKKDLSQQIADMPPEAAANMILDSLGKMSPDNRNSAIAAFLNQFDQDMAGEDFEDDEDTETPAKRG